MELTTKNGYTFQIDPEDFELASEIGWYGAFYKKVRKSGEWNKPYIIRNTFKNGKRGIEYLHRRILDPQKGCVCDHINGDTLDFRRSNLRICTQVQNSQNAIKQSNNTSGYKGVMWYKRNKKWLAQIRANGKGIYLGLFSLKESAAIAYNVAATKYFGEFAQLNTLVKELRPWQ